MTGLPTQTIAIPFGQGVDTKTDAKQVATGKLLTLQNGFFQSPGSIRKRYGYSALSQSLLAGGAIASAQAFEPYSSELVLADGQNLNSYDASGGKWAGGRGTYVPVDLNVSQVAANTTSFFSPDTAVSGGLQCSVWAGGGNNYYSITDLTTGLQVITPTVLAANVGGVPKVFAFNGAFFLFVYVGSSSTLGYYTIQVSAPTAVPSFAANITTTTAGIYDVNVIGGRLYVAVARTGTNDLLVSYIDTSLVLHSGLYTGAVGATGCVTVFGDAANNVWLGYGKSAGSFYFQVVSSAGAAVQAETLLIGTGGAATTSVTGIFNGGNGNFAATTVASNVPATYFAQGAIGGGTVNNVIVRSLSLASRIFIQGGQFYALTAYTTDSSFHSNAIQNTYFLIQFTTVSTYTVVCKIAPQTAGGGQPSVLPNAAAVSAGVWRFPYAAITQLQISSSGIPLTVTGVSSAEVNFAPTYVPRKTYAGNLILGGGVPTGYDGVSGNEFAFHLYPENLSLTPAGAGGFLAAGTYGYTATYEWIDGQGNTVRSAAAVPVSVTVTGATSQVTVSVATLRVTGKLAAGSKVEIKIWRTAANGTVYFLLTNLNLGVRKFNDPTADSVTLVDTNPDSYITGAPQLYTTGGEVGNNAPPATCLLTNYRSRLIAVPCEGRTSFWYTKQALTGFPAEFSAFFVQNITPNGGAITAIAQMDDKLVLFKGAQIYFVTGEGPAPNGTLNDFSVEQIITSDVGTTVPASVVLTPDGLVFQGAKGLCLLTRNLQVVYLGPEVEAFTGTQTVTSAQIVATENQVRFTMSGGVCLVRDYQVGQWAVYTNHSAVAACLFQGAYTYVTAGGLVMQENPAVFTDAGAFVQLTVVTAWLKLANLAGYQRVRRAQVLGTYKSAHSLVVGVAYDFAAANSQTETIATAPGPYEYKVLLEQQKCEAIQFTLQDSQSSAFGEGMSLSGLTLEVGVKKGLNKLKASSVYG